MGTLPCRLLARSGKCTPSTATCPPPAAGSSSGMRPRPSPTSRAAAIEPSSCHQHCPMTMPLLLLLLASHAHRPCLRSHQAASPTSQQHHRHGCRRPRPAAACSGCTCPRGAQPVSSALLVLLVLVLLLLLVLLPVSVVVQHRRLHPPHCAVPSKRRSCRRHAHSRTCRRHTSMGRDCPDPPCPLLLHRRCLPRPCRAVWSTWRTCRRRACSGRCTGRMPMHHGRSHRQLHQNHITREEYEVRL